MKNDADLLWKIYITMISKLAKKYKHLILHVIKAPLQN